MYFRPKDSAAGDIIPYYRDNAYQLFYLRDYRNVEKYGEGTPWHLLETKDFVHFAEKGEVISRGGKDDQDLYVYTGSVFEKDGESYIFYTGFNPYFIERGKRREEVMLTVSTDFKTWTKKEDFHLCAPDCFEPHDFRDPFVFYNEEKKEYNMLLAARLNYGPSRRRGCTAVAVSDDLLNWTVKEEPFYSPRLYFTHECPDLFRMGEWWYLVFSEFTEKCETHYRMSKSLEGPWLTPEFDTFDNRNFYAAKTVFDGKERYAIGWNPTHIGDEDYSDTQWGGSIVAHRILQEPDGQLFVALPETVREAYRKPISFQEGNIIGDVFKTENGWRIGRSDGYSSLDLGQLLDNCRISFNVTMKEGCKMFYLFLNSDKDNEAAYYVTVDLIMGRLGFDRWPRKRSDYPFMPETERKIPVQTDKKYQIDVIKDGTVLEVYFDNKIAMSARMYEFSTGTFGFASSFGEAEIGELAYLTTDE